MAAVTGTSTEAGPRRRLPLLPLVASGSALALAWGWNIRDEFYLSAESGLGYGLGVLGLSFMVLLLLYSLRKRVRAMRSWGPIRHWFGIHMFLGVVGPVAILFHSNFRLGSLNSTVALVCVILVAASGLIGRYIYPKIHHGLYGRRTSLRELRSEADASREAVGSVVAGAPGVSQELAAFETYALAEDCGLLTSAWRFAGLPIRSRIERRRCLTLIGAADGMENRRDVGRELDECLTAIRRVAEYSGYERLFSLWHAFHLPFCIMLFLAAAVHVVAVHMY
jgi:hypothetical protein